MGSELILETCMQWYVVSRRSCSLKTERFQKAAVRPTVSLTKPALN